MTYTGYSYYYYPPIPSSPWPYYPPAMGQMPPMPAARVVGDTRPPTRPDPATLLKDWLNFQDLQQRRQQVPEDKLLRYNAVDKGINSVKSLFTTLPKAVCRGLRGTPDYTFSELMQVTKVPYYLGGAFLALSPFLGGNRGEGIRQGAAVALYLLGTGLSHLFINTLYRMRYGVDLTMMYRSKSGQVEHVFASTDFPRFDLLSPEQYRKMARKMGISEDVVEQDGAVRENLRHIIGSSRALKLIVANLLAAIGAGYIARSDKWLAVPEAFPVIAKAWKDPGTPLAGKLKVSLSTLGEALRAPFLDKFSMKGASLWQKGVVYGGLAMLLGTAWYILFNGLPRKQYTAGWPGPLQPGTGQQALPASRMLYSGNHQVMFGGPAR